MNESKTNIGYILFLSIVAALGGFLFGYDTAVISGTIAQVSQQFGLTTLQEGWYVGCALVGSIGGVACAGVLSDKAGRKNTMILSAILFSASAIGCALSASFNELVVYRIIGGIGIGIVSIISPLYISEVSIAQYRGRLVSLYQLAITVGFLGAYLANYQLMLGAESAGQSGYPWIVKIFSDEIWRGMLGLETVPALLFFLIIFFIPESPRWLVLRNKDVVAGRILQRIYGSKNESEIQINAIRQVIGKESKSEWAMLLQPGILKAVMIGVAIAILGQFMGVNAVLYYGPSIFEKSGLSNGDSLFYQVLVGTVNMLTTVLALVIIDKVGRKKAGILRCIGHDTLADTHRILFYQRGRIRNTEYCITCLLLKLYFLLCHIDMRSHLGTPFRNVSDQSPGPGYVHCRLLTLDRNIPYRTINPLDVADNHSGRYFPDFRRYVHPLHADYMETGSGNNRKKP